MKYFNKHRRGLIKQSYIRGTKATVESSEPRVVLENTVELPPCRLEIKGNTYQEVGGPLLPSAYQQVEYIQSGNDETNVPYIDTGVTPTNNTGVNIVYKSYFTGGRTQFILGARKRNDGTIFYGLNGSSSMVGDKFIWDIYLQGTQVISNIERSSDKMQSALMPTDNGTFKWTIKNLETEVEETIVTPTAEISTGETIRIFGFSASHTLAGLYVYECQIYENGVMIRSFIPCYRKSDGVAGLYDLVEGAFYTTPRSTFIKGENNNTFVPISLHHPQPIQNTGDNELELSVKPIDVKIPLNVRLCGIDGYNDILTVDWQAKKAQINKKIMYANVADLIRDGNAEIDSIQQNGNTYYDIVICNIPRWNGGTAYCTHCPTSTSQNCEMFCVFGENADTELHFYYINQATTEEFKEWCVENNVMIAYVLQDNECIELEGDDISQPLWDLKLPEDSIAIIEAVSDIPVSGFKAVYYSRGKEDRYSLTVHYRDREGNTLLESKVSLVRCDSRYLVIPPEIEGYEPLVDKIEGYLTENKEITITYKEK